MDTQIGSTISNSSERIEEFYTVDMLDHVAKVYEADLKAFNYTHIYSSMRSSLLRLHNQINKEPLYSQHVLYE